MKLRLPFTFAKERATSRSAQTTRPLRVAFVTTVAVNVGDEFIREGVKSFFDEALGDYEPLYVNKHDPIDSLKKPLLDETIACEHKFRDADVIVQSGTPVYWRLPHSQCYAAGWGGPLWDWDGGIFQLAPAKPFLNLGAGTCQPSEDDLATLVNDEKCVEFMRKAGRCAAMTTVRDPLASKALKHVGVDHELMACPALHAARRMASGRALSAERNNLLAVNLMELAGHYQLKPENDAHAWQRVIGEILPTLRKRYRLLFVAHDDAERKFMEQLRTAGETVFFSTEYRDYLEVYSRVGGMVANRVHGAVCVAGFGRPTIIIGNDSRIGIARPIGIPAIDGSSVTGEWIIDALETQMSRRQEVHEQLLSLRESSARHYVQRIRKALSEHPATKDVFL